MINLIFKSITEELPKHKQKVVYIGKRFDFDAISVSVGVFEYEWVHVHLDGSATGLTAIYNVGDGAKDNWELFHYICDNHGNAIVAPENFYWMPEEEYRELLKGK